MKPGKLETMTILGVVIGETVKMILAVMLFAALFKYLMS